MPNWRRPKHFIVAAAILLVSFFALRAHAAINQQINYQGKLYNSSGQQVANDAYNFRFSLCTSPSSCGSPVWTETYDNANKIYVTSSLFSTMLGSQTALSGVDFNQTLYLQVEVGGTSTPSWETLLPRKILGAVPAAFRAATSSYADNSGLLQGNTWASPGAIGSGTASTGIFTNATSSILRVTGNSYFGTVASGTWQGSVVANAYGGTGQDSSAWTGIVKVTGGVWGTSTVSLSTDVSGVLPIVNGGTGTSTAPALGEFLIGDGSGAYRYITTSTLGITATAAGTDGQIQFNNGGSFGASANLFWNNASRTRWRPACTTAAARSAGWICCCSPSTSATVPPTC